MIGYLRGRSFDTFDKNLIIDVQGVGYLVQVTEATLVWSLSQGEIGLYIHTLVRENTLDLYGFETQNQLYFFRKLLEVSGIGPKSALGIIGLASTDTLYQALVSENIAFLSSVPGVGKKTAEKMCIELRDKLKDYARETEVEIHQDDTDVIDALVALGYSPAQAYQALSKISQEITDVNEKIKAALNAIKN
jgi:Holliday junction DNA helicase RuvA